MELSLIITPSAVRDRDRASLDERITRLDHALEAVRELALFWPTGRSDELFEDFEVQLRELLRGAGRATAELMLSAAEARDRRNRPSKYSIGETVYRMSTPEPRSFNTWFGVVRYRRSYARPVNGGVGHFPLDFELGLLGDRISPNLLSVGARLATRMSFAEAREVLGWFVPQPPSTEVLEQTVLGLGHHTADWFEVAPVPEDDGEVLVIMLDGKCVPTARESELQKRHAFEFALEEAERRGFGKGTDKTVQILTDGDPDLHLYTDEYFHTVDFPHRVVTVDVVHVLEKLWDAGRARHREGSKELAAWVRVQENRLYGDMAPLVLDELRIWLAETPKTGPGNKGRRKRLSDAIRYLERRRDKVHYGTYRAQDLEVGTGQVEGAIRYVIAKRCDHGGMRWIRQRAQAVIQLRCIDVNGHWQPFVRWALARLRTAALADGRRARLQTNVPAKLTNVAHAA